MRKIFDKLFLVSVAGVIYGVMYFNVGFLAHVSGESMEPTLLDRDVLIIKRASGYQVGDIVSVDVGDRSIVKRVAAKYPKFVKYDPYHAKFSDENKSGYIQIKKGQLFILGDNPAVSWDSRDFGPVLETSVEGIVVSSFHI